MTEQTEVKEKLTEESLFEKLVVVFNSMWELDAQIKDICEDAKESDVEDITLIKSIAKSKAYNKTSDLEEKAKLMLSKIDKLVA